MEAWHLWYVYLVGSYDTTQSHKSSVIKHWIGVPLEKNMKEMPADTHSDTETEKIPGETWKFTALCSFYNYFWSTGGATSDNGAHRVNSACVAGSGVLQLGYWMKQHPPAPSVGDHPVPAQWGRRNKAGKKHCCYYYCCCCCWVWQKDPTGHQFFKMILPPRTHRLFLLVWNGDMIALSSSSGG